MVELGRLRNWLVPTRPKVTLFIVLVWADCTRKALSLPVLPAIVGIGDAESYLSFADYRPPGYPSLLYIYQTMFDGLTYLPQVQVVLFYTSVLLLALSVASLTQNILSAFLIAGFGGVRMVPDFDPASVMSDCLYGSLVVTGAACFLFSVSTKHQRLVWFAALFLRSPRQRGPLDMS
jgi:hypothetical protein